MDADENMTFGSLFSGNILEMDVPQKYYLSAKAARGILRRAEKRGKELPKLLEHSLRILAELPGQQETEMN